MSEFAVGPIGNNVHYGDCLNPWNQEHTPGGSSVDRVPLWRRALFMERWVPIPVAQ